MEMAQFPILSAILFSTIFGLVTILFIPDDRPKLVKQVSLAYAAVGLVLALWVYCAYDTQKGGLQFVERTLWVKSLGIYWFNALDGINAPMLLLTAVVLFTGVLTMWEMELRVKEFFAFMYLLVAGVYGVFISHGPLLDLRLVRRIALPHVPADCHLGRRPARNTAP